MHEEGGRGPECGGRRGGGRGQRQGGPAPGIERAATAGAAHRGRLPARRRRHRGLRFIRQARTLGLTLAEIKDVLELQRGGAAPCDRVTGLLDQRIVDIDRTLAELRALRRAQTRARDGARESRRRGEEATVCRIIDTAPNTDLRESAQDREA